MSPTLKVYAQPTTQNVTAWQYNGEQLPDFILVEVRFALALGGKIPFVGDASTWEVSNTDDLMYGDWILRNSKGEITFMTNSKFRNNYEVKDAFHV